MAQMIFQLGAAGAHGVQAFPLFVQCSGKGVVLGAFLFRFHQRRPQLLPLRQHFVELRLFAVGLEQLVRLLLQTAQGLAGGAQTKTEAGAVEGVAHAVGAQAGKGLQFRQAETENAAENLAADAAHEPFQHFRFTGVSFGVGQRQNAAARAGPPRQSQNAVRLRRKLKTAASLPAARQRQAAAFAAAGVGIAGKHGAQKFQTGGFARLVAPQKDGQTRRQIFHGGVGENAEFVNMKGTNVH